MAVGIFDLEVRAEEWFSEIGVVQGWYTEELVSFATLALTQTLSDNNSGNWNDSLLIGIGLFSLSDTNTQSDSVTSVLGLNKTLSDTNPQSEDIKIGYGLSLSDTNTQSEDIKIGIGLILSDNNIQSDAIQVGVGLSVSDNTSQDDSLTLVLGLTETFFDSQNQNDAVTPVLGLTELLPDNQIQSDTIQIGVGLTLSDTNTQGDDIHIGFGLTLSDTNTQSDAIQIGLGLSLSDSVNLSDAIQVGLGLSLSDTNTQSDSLITILGLNQFCSDSQTQSDSLQTEPGLSLADSQVQTDAIQTGNGSNISDSETLLDFVTLIENELLSLNDDGSSNWNDDGLLVLGSQLSLSDDANNWGDTVITAIVIFLLISDSNNLSDSFSAVSGPGLALSDNNNISDSLNLNEGDAVALTDINSILDSLSAGDGLLLFDNNTQVDSIDSVLGIFVVVQDDIGFLTDAVFKSQGKIVLLGEANALSDSINRLEVEELSVSDLTTITIGMVIVPVIADGFGLLDDDTNVFLEAPPLDGSLIPFYSFINAFPKWVLSWGGLPDNYNLTTGLYTGANTYAFNPDIAIQAWGDPPVPIREFVPGVVISFMVSSIRQAFFDGRYLRFTYLGHRFVVDGLKATSTIA